MRLEGKRAIVTGSGSEGIGRAIARALAREGCDVALHGHAMLERTEELAREIRAATGRRAFAFDADFSDPVGTRAFMTEAIASLGGIDILVVAAAAITRTPFLELSDGEFDLVQKVNLYGSFVCGQEAARWMAGNGRTGRIIMVTSVNQQKIIRNQAHYCASKGGMMQLARTMAAELAPAGITVNIIAPGAILTDFNRHIMSDDATRRRFEEPIPAGRLGRPEDFAEAAVFLAGPGTEYITGTSIFIDGGRSLV